MTKFQIAWHDAARDPQCEPNPDYPDGVDLDVAGQFARSCVATLPYPVRRCGAFIVVCETCGCSTAVSTAGRADDPRSVRIPCKERPN